MTTCLILFSNFSTTVFALTEHEDISSFLNLLNEQTTLATNTRINKDFVPGMLSVLTHEDMYIKGYRTVWDAIASLPGVVQSIDSTGKKNLTIRGISQTIGSAKIKLLLNNAVLNSSSSSTVGTLLDTPISQIERIEFIRGPGSAVHGEFALAGVINVITNKNNDELSLSLGDDESVIFNSRSGFNVLNNELTGNFNLVVQQSEGEILKVGQDKATTGIGYSPGIINNKTDFSSAILDMTLFNTKLLIQYQQSNRGDYYGKDNYLPPPKKQTVISESSSSFSLSRMLKNNKNTEINWSLNYLINDIEKNALFLAVAPIYGGLNSDDDIISFVDLSEERLDSKLNVKYKTGLHKLFAELQFSHLTINKYKQFINLDPITKTPDTELNQFSTPIPEGEQRSIVSLVLQDEYYVDEEITVTTGIRYDDYDDIGQNFSPRIAAVWRLSSSDILKVQWAKAFRPPTLLELNGSLGSSIEPETISTLELSYIYFADDYSIKSTLYQSKINNLIAFKNSAPFGYSNYGNANISGIETEISNTVFEDIEISGTLSLQDSDMPSDALKLYELVPILMTGSVTYNYGSKKAVNLSMRYSDKVGRVNGDNRSKLDSSTIFDFTATKDDLLGINDLSSQLIVQNFTSEKIKFPAENNTYEDDYLFSQSPTVWLKLLYNGF